MLVQYLPAARDALARIPDKFRRQIISRADALGTNPFPIGSKKLHGAFGDTYRVRQGAFRILYIVQGGQVYIVAVIDRKESYTKKGRR